MQGLLTITELSELLNIKEKTIYTNYIKWNLPHTRIGRSLRFNLDEINTWLGNQKVGNFKVRNMKKLNKNDNLKDIIKAKKILLKKLN